MRFLPQKKPIETGEVKFKKWKKELLFNKQKKNIWFVTLRDLSLRSQDFD